MREVSIYCKGSDMHVGMCVSALPNRLTPGPINGSDVCWHDVIADVPDDVSDGEVLRRYRKCVLWKLHTARFDQLRPGAIIRREIAALDDAPDDALRAQANARRAS